MNLKRKLQDWLGITSLAKRIVVLEIGEDVDLILEEGSVVYGQDGALHNLNTPEGKAVEYDAVYIKKGYDSNK